jgi:hypothetical protein
MRQRLADTPATQSVDAGHHQSSSAIRDRLAVYLMPRLFAIVHHHGLVAPGASAS